MHKLLYYMLRLVENNPIQCTELDRYTAAKLPYRVSASESIACQYQALVTIQVVLEQ